MLIAKVGMDGLHTERSCITTSFSFRQLLNTSLQSFAISPSVMKASQSVPTFFSSKSSTSRFAQYLASGINERVFFGSRHRTTNFAFSASSVTSPSEVLNSSLRLNGILSSHCSNARTLPMLTSRCRNPF